MLRALIDLRKSLNILIDRPNTELGRSSFAHRAAIPWNSLPDNVRHFSNPIASKNRLEKAKNDVVNMNFGKEVALLLIIRIQIFNHF